MIKHIVFFKLNNQGNEQKDEIIIKLNQLKNDIPQIRGLEVGINFADETRAFDLSLTVVVDSKEALDLYANDPKHQTFIAFVKPLLIETKVVDYEIEQTPIAEEFGSATITKKANVYFDGAVTSRTIIDKDGQRKTLGIMMPGKYTFGTELAEHMEILAGKVEVQLSESSNIETIHCGEYFEVPANSKFDIKVLEITDYCCTYIN
jgi:uncharacterized protein YaiE (UPF0345 family)